VRESATDDVPQRSEVLTILRGRVGGHLPAALPERIRDVEASEVLDLVRHREREDRQLVPAGDQLERSELLDLAREPSGNVTRISLDAPVAVEAESLRSRASSESNDSRRPAL
jgi:hypothetical protein